MSKSDDNVDVRIEEEIRECEDGIETDEVESGVEDEKNSHEHDMEDSKMDEVE